MLRPSRTAPVLGAAILAGALATACSAPAARPRVEVAPAALASSVDERSVDREVTEPAVIGPTILIDRVHDPNHVAPGAAAGLSTTIEKTIERAGFTAAPRSEGSTSATVFLVTPTVVALTVTPEGSSTTISCRVTLRIAPWSAADQRERWEPHTTASATGEARATTSSACRQVELGIRDCLEGAVHAAATRQVIPFLQRIAIDD